MTMTAAPVFSSFEVCRLTGITYRILDYWIRTGAIVIDRPTPGSGRHRFFTGEELRNIQQLVEVYRDAHVMLERVRSGELWRELSA